MPKTPFDHVKAIYEDQSLDYFDKLEPADQKSFSVFMVNRIISMTPEFVPIVNMAQMHYDALTPRDVYLLYSQSLPKGRRYSKYIKGAKETKYEEWLVELVAKYFSVSQQEATEYCDTFYRTEEGKADLRAICELFAVDAKQLKKVKL